MKRVKFLFILSCLVSQASSELNKKEEIKNKLSEMVRTDQSLRSKLISQVQNKALLYEIRKADEENTKILKEILSLYNWITISEFGEEADRNTWLLVQHADHDREFQKEILLRLEKLCESGETKSQNFAYLYDRVAIKESRPQRYGTQGIITEGKWIAYEIEDPTNLDFRRSLVGLVPFHEYVDQINTLLFE